MMNLNPIDELDDRTVVRTVRYLAEDLRPAEPTLVRTEAEARLVISALLEQAQVAHIAPDDLLPTESEALPAARRALTAAGTDAEARKATAELLAEPPRGGQTGVEAAVASTSVLTFLITWLQTRVTLRIHRKDGRSEVSFTVDKQAADGRLLRAIATTFGSILGLPTPITPPEEDEQPTE